MFLDRAVFAAYGWDASLSDEQILERAVALNAERAAEESRGVVRWLRPSFQTPSASPAGSQSDLALPEVVTTGRKGKVVKLPWPTTTREQIQALRTALAQPGSDPAGGLAKRFQGARVAQVALLLEAMAALGQVRAFEGRYAA